MPVNAMKRLTVVTPASDTDLLLRRLMHLGCIELTDRPAGEGVLDGCCAPTASCEKASALLQRVTQVLPFLAERRHKRRAVRTEVDFSTFLASPAAERAEKTVVEAEKLLTFIDQTGERIRHEQALMRSLVPYLDFPYPLNDEGTQKTKFLLGALPSGTSVADLKDKGDTAGFIVEVLSSDRAGTHVAVITHREAEEDTRVALAELGFTEAAFADTNGRAVAVFDAAQKRAARYEDELKHAHLRLDVLAENYGEVCALLDVLQASVQTAALAQKLNAVGPCTVLSAWCPAYEQTRIARLLDAMTAAYEFTDPEITEKPPRPAADPPYTGRAASLLGLYRTPWFGKWHAALPLTLFYALFFGLLFADAGYGLVTLLAALALYLPRRLPTSVRRAALLLGCCGIALLLFGIPLGNYFNGTLLGALRESGATDTLTPLPTLAATLTAARTVLLRHRVLLALSLLPAAAYLCTVFVLRTVFLARAHRARELPLTVGPHFCFFVSIGLFWLHPLVGAAALAAALLFIIFTGIMAGRAKKERLIALGGNLLDLLSELTLALCAARTLPLAIAGALCLWLSEVALAQIPAALAMLLAVAVCFAASHALNLLINAIPTLVGRARLGYMAHFAAYYPGRAVLLRPLQATNRYTRDTSLPVDGKALNAAPSDLCEHEADDDTTDDAQ